MMLEFRWPLLGVIIPVAIIACTAYGSHYFILRHHLSTTQQIIYECLASMIWASYALAIYTSPGEPPKNYNPKRVNGNDIVLNVEFTSHLELIIVQSVTNV